jgi:uncharacterized protein
MSYRHGAGATPHTPGTGRWRVSFRRLAAAGALLALAACTSSPPSYFYTLTGGGNAAASATSAATGSSPLFIEVLPASMPLQLQRPQLVLNTGPGQVDILEQRRWSQPLGDEIGQALSEDLTSALPAIDVYRSARPQGLTVYRVAVDVQRFDSVLGQRATLDAVWSVTRLPQTLTLTCHSAISVPAAQGYDALVASHRQALALLAQQIGTAVRGLAQVPAGSKTASLAGCPAEH